MFNSSKTEHSPSRVLRPDNIRWMMSLSDLRIYLCSFLPAFPALHKCSPFEIPRVRGGMKTRKMIFENALLHFGVVQLLSKQAFISAFCQVITEVSFTVPQQLQLLTSNTSIWHPMEDFTKSRQAQAVWPAK
jgi:hypothetical protein